MPRTCYLTLHLSTTAVLKMNTDYTGLSASTHSTRPRERQLIKTDTPPVTLKTHGDTQYQHALIAFKYSSIRYCLTVGRAAT